MFYILFFIKLNPSISYTKEKFRNIFILLARISFSVIIIELVLHATQAYSLHSFHGRLLPFFSDESLTASLLLKGTLFTCKYIVYYGATNLINYCVGMKTTDLPRCIFLMHTNSELWRFFDTGIYKFIKSYLYIPLGGNLNKGVISVLPVITSFAFISYWHGMSWNVTLWTFLNFLMVSFELFGFEFVRRTRIFTSMVKF